MNLIDQLRQGIRNKESRELSHPSRVLIFGPGDSNGKRKRRNLAARLRRIGFKVSMSESLSRKVPSFLTAHQQESEHWRLFDYILILNFSHGANQEVAAFAHEADFRSRAFIVFPEQFDPLYSSSFGSEVLKAYPFRVRANDQEWETCKASDLCLEHARSRRALDVELISSTM